MTSLAWHPAHAELFASGAYDGALLQWAAACAQPLAEGLGAHGLAIWALAWHPLGHVLASGSQDGSTRFWARNWPGDPVPDRDDRRDAETGARMGGGAGGAGSGGGGAVAALLAAHAAAALAGKGPGADGAGAPLLPLPAGACEGGRGAGGLGGSVLPLGMEAAAAAGLGADWADAQGGSGAGGASAFAFIDGGQARQVNGAGPPQPGRRAETAAPARTAERAGGGYSAHGGQTR